MRYAIIGAGAIGGYYGGLLAGVADVTFIARGATLAALRERGIEVRSAGGTELLPVRFAADASELPPVDVVIIATKSGGLRDALATAAPLIAQGASVMPVQNGVEAPHVVAEGVPTERVIPCVVRGFLELVAPGVVAYHGGPRSFTFGSWDGRPSSVVSGIAADIAAAGFEGIVHDDIWMDVWRKAMFVVPFGALGALADQPLGVLLTSLRAELAGAMAEVREVGVATGVALPSDAVADTLAFADAMPVDATTSMQRDILAGLPSELDSQVGGIVRLADRAGVPVPRLALMERVLRLRPGQAG